ncbi:MAG: hypothetical protein U9R42_12915 [Bacteroidota bacterium]|nr:hypothetical protein [Bacteroidota bacterium]
MNYQEKQSHLSNLISLAYADGILKKDEEQLLIDIGKKMGISEEEILKKLANPVKQKFLIPEKETVRYHQLYDFLSMIMIDGDIHPNEIIILKKYAKQLKFKEDIVDPLIDKTKEYLKKGYNSNAIQSNLKDLINKIY